MKLKDWLRGEWGRGKALAKDIGIAPSKVSEMASGVRQVPLEHCPRIQAFTGGAVTCEELRPDKAEYFALIRANGAAAISTPVDRPLALIDRRQQSIPIDFPDRRAGAGG